MRFIVATLGLLGCHGLTCGEGTVESDGVCLAAATDDTDTSAGDPPTFADVFDALPACVADEGDGRLDLATGCADGACAGMTAAEISAALGAQPGCSPSYFDVTEVDCAWDIGITASFADLDGNGMPDDDSTSSWLDLGASYEGATTDGLGVGASWSCFFDALGEPDFVDLWGDHGDYVLASASWFDENLGASDWVGEGAPSSLTLYAPY